MSVCLSTCFNSAPTKHTFVKFDIGTLPKKNQNLVTIADKNIRTFTWRRMCVLLYAFFYPPMTMEQTACSKTSAYKIQMLGNYPEESIQHPEHGKSLKSRVCVFHYCWHQTATKVLSSSEMVSGYQDGPGGIHIRESSNQTVLYRRHCCIILLSVTYEGLQYKGNIMFSC